MPGPSDPFAVLGLGRDADLRTAGAARRRLAREHHPDHGGDEARMREINDAYRQVLFELSSPAEPPATPPPPASRWARRRGEPRWRPHVQHDWPSFTITALPAEAFEALLVVSTWVGEVLADDPPYLLDVVMSEPVPCWCRLELLPEAGASMVNLTVAGIEGGPAPDPDDVRDVWLTALNELHRAES